MAVEYTDQPIALDDQNPGGSPTQHFNVLTAGSPGTFRVDALGLSIGNGAFRVDQDGLWVGDTLIVDSHGLNSLNNFRQDSITDIAAFETASTSYVDVTGGTMTPLVLERAANVLFYLNIEGRNKNFEDSEATVGYSCIGRIYCVEHAVSEAVLIFKGQLGFYYTFDVGGDSWSSDITNIQTSKVIIQELSAGTHTFKFQVSAVNGGTARAANTDIGYTVLGI